ncbi:MAG: hypothetical protein Q8O40_17215 [Chloroflexota bacterium]|nr:hypothetical protein [Chloroflexota bacterium]
METVKSLLAVKFAEPLRPWHELRELMNVAAANPKLEIQAPPFSIELADKRQAIVLHIRAVTFEQERVRSADAAIVEGVGLLSKMHRASPFPAIGSVSYDTLFIEPFSLPFHELVSLVKRRFFKPTAVTESATDVAVVFDVHEGDVIKHLRIGPMEANQLRSQFLRWPPDNVAERFAFVSLGYEYNRRVDFDEEALKGVLGVAAAWQNEQAATIISVLHQEGG